MMLLMSVGSIVALILIEMRLCSACRKISLKPVPEPIKDLVMDNDVKAEEFRVNGMELDAL